MKRVWSPPSFSARLILAFFLLILLTTISAGIPAYLLTRSALEQQAWSQVEGARRATRSLLAAEEEQLDSLVTLFAERPTLLRLVQEGSTMELESYLAAFQAQSGLDILLVCDPDGGGLASEAWRDTCTNPPEHSFLLLEGRPALVAGEEILDEGGERLGTAWGGIWLDERFLAQMALRTGLAQSILGPDGDRLASTVPELDARPAGTAEGIVEQYELEAAGEPYYAASFPLAEGGLQAEVALPVARLVRTEADALLILAGSTAVVAILGGLLGILIVRQLVSPLQQLTGVAERIGGGDLVAPIPLVAGPAEVRTLAAALQRSQASMLEALGERSEALAWRDTLIQSIVEGVVTVDNDGCITFLSQGGEELSGWTHEEAVGRPLDAVFPVDGEDGLSFLAQLPARGGKRQIGVRDRQGKKVVLAVTGAELAPPAGEEAQMALVLRDVTQEEAVRHLRSYFLANISHEFLTPLSTLNASMELLLDPAENLSATEMRELLKPTYLSLRGLQTLIDNLLESSSIEAGQFTLRRQPVDLNEILAQALQLVEPLLERRQQLVSVGRPGSVPVIYGDPARLTQVLVNLLANASKYSPPHKAIDVRMEQLGSALRISVADQGPGIPEAERADVFRSFVRGEAADSEQYGIGLGLYVVQTTIMAHGGRVGIDDRPGGGSIVWFELPLQEGNDGR